jgi:hypothetical protein
VTLEEAGYFTGQGTFAVDLMKLKKLKGKYDHDNMGAALITALHDVQLTQVCGNF